PFLEAGWLQRQPTPWGIGLELISKAHRQGLAATVPSDPTGLARNTIGEILAHASDRPDARWQTYNLLSGTAAAVPPILELAREKSHLLDSERILDGLTRELRAHRARGGDQVTELHLLWTLLPLARKKGRLVEYSGDLKRALEISAGHPRKHLAFASLKTELDLQKGTLEEGERTLRKALEVVIDEDPGRQALILLQLARLMVRQQRLGEARALLEQLLPVLKKRKATAQIASCYFHLGNIALHEDRLDEARNLHEKGLRIRREEGLAKSLGASLSALGAVSIAHGDYGQAMAYYQEAEEVLREHGEIGETSFALLGLGRVHRRLGDFSKASRYLRQALELRGGAADRVGEALARLLVAENHLDLGKLEEAMADARRSSFDLRLGPEVSQLGDAERLLGRIHVQRRQLDRAREHLRAAYEIHRRHQDLSSALIDLSWQLRVAMIRQEPEEIRRLCDEIRTTPETLKPWERREVLAFRLYQATQWLRDRGRPAGSDPILHLQEAYRELLRKAEHLEATLRNVFLFQVEENAAILQAATEAGLSLPVPAVQRAPSG
ncbi:MAG: tetratricopeptide repeat protein, partial [Acidobacteria bacterium]|nr:tetratricopeptide repeat protein [Acidobacteriota bacterium]